jgi:hypothetical protein
MIQVWNEIAQRWEDESNAAIERKRIHREFMALYRASLQECN